MRIAQTPAVLATTLAAMLLAAPAQAETISFSSGWQEQRLQLFNSNSYSFGQDLGIASDGAVSLVWARTPQSEWGARAASWAWRVDESVSATPLTHRGGDDRNISVYFVFLPEEVARSVGDANIRQLRGNPNVRILQYVWGGDAARGARFASPYAPGQGANVILRPAGTGAHSESVDLAADFRAAFGAAPTALVGLAVSADSDDTGGRVRATLGPISLR